MARVHDAPIQPLDVILFRGVDPVSRAICFFQERRLGRGDFSHAGLAVTREVLDLPCLEPGRVYVWESTLSAPSGFFSRFTDKVPDAETEGVRFGVQLRDLELVVPGYVSDGGKVAWSRYLGPRPQLPVLRERLRALHQEYGHADYALNLFALFSVVYPALCPARDALARAHDRLTRFLDEVLPRAREQAPEEGSEQHMFCSEWVGTVYARLGLTKPEFDPQLAAPVSALLRPDVFAEPVLLEER